MTRLLRLRSVRELTGLSQSSIYDLSAKGKFPRQVRITDGTVGWVEEEISAWIDARVAQRDQTPLKPEAT